jgi:branched-chain amino acid aminotransferase
MKAYKTKDGYQMFRPYENAKRMNDSAERLCLPTIPEEDFVNAITELINVDYEWIPNKEGTSLYIRPYMFGNDEALGVHAVKRATFVVILSPVGNYYAEGLNPVKISIENQDVRAVRGGTGYAKCGGNYAASLRAGKRAEEKGISQVLWLDGVERKYIEEVGAMNVMFKIKGEIVTPMLTGSVLPGITRKSCIEILRNWGYKVTERLISVDELLNAVKNGELEEAWGTGTAAVVSPIGQLFYEDVNYIVSNNQIGELTQKLYDELTGIQWGKVEDKYSWVKKVKI